MPTFDELLDDLNFEVPDDDPTSSPSSSDADETRPPDPGWDHLKPSYWSAWLAHVAGNRLVVVVDRTRALAHGHIPYKLYAVDERGILDQGEAITSLCCNASERYLSACSGLDNRQFAACSKHGNNLPIVANADAIRANAGVSAETYPDCWRNAATVDVSEIDADLTVIGTPAGVWDFQEHRLLSPTEARERLVATTIRYSYDADADHPLAAELFTALYGDLVDTSTREFARWRLAATALVRRPRKELIAKISPSGSAKTTEDNLNRNVFFPLVVNGERPAIELNSRWNTGGSSHNSYLASFGRPARRINISETAGTKGRLKAFDSQLLRDLSEASTVTYRDPGPNPKVTLPFDAHLFISGNVPEQGQDLLHIAGTEDGAKAVRTRLRGSPYDAIPEEERNSLLRDYGNLGVASTPAERDDIEHFNRTLLRLMLDGIAQHWDALMDDIPTDTFSDSVINDVAGRGAPTWTTEWLPHVLTVAVDGKEETNTVEVYRSYLTWHEANVAGKPELQRTITNAVKAHYQAEYGKSTRVDDQGKRKEGLILVDLALADADFAGFTD